VSASGSAIGHCGRPWRPIFMLFNIFNESAGYDRGQMRALRAWSSHRREQEQATKLQRGDGTPTLRPIDAPDSSMINLSPIRRAIAGYRKHIAKWPMGPFPCTHRRRTLRAEKAAVGLRATSPLALQIMAACIFVYVQDRSNEMCHRWRLPSFWRLMRIRHVGYR
jgi:hypothetical protein